MPLYCLFIFSLLFVCVRLFFVRCLSQTFGVFLTQSQSASLIQFLLFSLSSSFLVSHNLSASLQVSLSFTRFFSLPLCLFQSVSVPLHPSQSVSVPLYPTQSVSFRLIPSQSSPQSISLYPTFGLRLFDPTNFKAFNGSVSGDSICTPNETSSQLYYCCICAYTNESLRQFYVNNQTTYCQQLNVFKVSVRKNSSQIKQLKAQKHFAYDFRYS